MNGAESLVKTLLANGVDTVFANPGTSEMHFVAALDAHPDMHCILCLFEGGTSAGADCYFRMKRDVAATLLHLAPGFGNAFANLHNARKGGSGLVNVVGEHATRHLAFESPLKGDIEAISHAVSHWTRRSPDAPSVARDGAEAIRAARSRGGQVATLILPADTAWNAADGPAMAEAPPPLQRPRPEEIEAAARRLAQPGAALMVGGEALFGAGFRRAARIAARTGATLVTDTLIPRTSKGADTPQHLQLPYAVAPKIAALDGTTSVTLVGSGRPVTFFAYPGKPSLPEPPGCPVMPLCRPEMDIAWTLDALEQATDAAGAQPAAVPMDLPGLPSGGALTLEKAGAAIAALLPENAILCNEAVSSGAALGPLLARARPHDMLGGTGGAIGWSLPGSVGAATACPDRKVVALTGDGSAMYTSQSLWTMAREGLDITVVVIANRGYQILRDELANVGVASYGANAQAMFDVENPVLDWVQLAQGHGVPGRRAADMDSFAAALRAGLDADGPALIELVL